MTTKALRSEIYAGAGDRVEFRIVVKGTTYVPEGLTRESQREEIARQLTAAGFEVTSVLWP